MINRLRVAFAIIAAAAFLSGCHSHNKSTTSVDQSTMCVASTDQEAMRCPAGQLIFARFDPKSSSSMRDYRVLNTIALYCNTNDPIIKNDAGVICVLTKARFKSLVVHNQPSDQQSSDSGSASSDSALQDQSSAAQNQPQSN